MKNPSVQIHIWVCNGQRYCPATDISASIFHLKEAEKERNALKERQKGCGHAVQAKDKFVPSMTGIILTGA